MLTSLFQRRRSRGWTRSWTLRVVFWGMALLALGLLVYLLGYRRLRESQRISFYFPASFVEDRLEVGETNIVLTTSKDEKDDERCALAEMVGNQPVSLAYGPMEWVAGPPAWMLTLYAPLIRREFAVCGYMPLFWGANHRGMLPRDLCVRSLHRKLARDSGRPEGSLDWIGDTTQGEYYSSIDGQGVILSVNKIPLEKCQEIIAGLRRNPDFSLSEQGASGRHTIKKPSQTLAFYKEGLGERESEAWSFALGQDWAEMIHQVDHNS